jgi:hypothetical protein
MKEVFVTTEERDRIKTLTEKTLSHAERMKFFAKRQRFLCPSRTCEYALPGG